MFDRTDCVKVIQSIGDVSIKVLQENDGGDPKTMKTRQPLVPLAPEAPTQRTMCVLASAYYCFASIGWEEDIALILTAAAPASG